MNNCLLTEATGKFPVHSMIIDIEGTEFTIPNSSNIRRPISLIASEVSCVLIENNEINAPSKIMRAFSTRLNYDLRPLLILPKNKSIYKFSNENYINTFRGRSHSSDGKSADEARKTIWHILEKYKVTNIYAKGVEKETIWLFYPECCDGFTDEYPKKKPRIIRDLKDFDCKKYDMMDQKLIFKLLDLVHKDEWLTTFMKDEYPTLVKQPHLHISLFEVLIFADFLIRNYDDDEDDDFETIEYEGITFNFLKPT